MKREIGSVRLVSKIIRTVCVVGLLASLWTGSAMAGTTMVPANGSTLPGSTTTLTWQTDGNYKQWWVRVGSTAASNNYYDSGRLINAATRSHTVSGLPTNGNNVYVRLYAKTQSGPWDTYDFVYKASGGTTTGGGSTDGGTTGGGSSEDTLAALDCSSGEVAKYGAGTWGCAPDLDTDTMADLACKADEIAVSDGSGNWDCASPSTPDTEDIIAPLEATLCTEGEELIRDSYGGLRCELQLSDIEWGECPCVLGDGAWALSWAPISLSTKKWEWDDTASVIWLPSPTSLEFGAYFPDESGEGVRYKANVIDDGEGYLQCSTQHFESSFPEIITNASVGWGDGSYETAIADCAAGLNALYLRQD